MKTKTVRGIVATKLGISEKYITIRAEKTGDFTTISLADDDRGILIEVPYVDVAKLVKGLR